MTRDIAILDFGSGRITAYIGRRGAAGTLMLIGSAHVQYAGFGDGDWLKPESLSKEISAALSAVQTEANVKIKHLYIGVPAEFSACVVRDLTLSFGKRRKILGADTEKLFEMGADFSHDAPGYTVINRQPVYYTLDDERRMIDPVGNVSGKLSGLLSYILAENKFTYFIDNIIEGLGIETAEYVSAPLAEAMFLLDDFKRDSGAVLIDVGYITTSVAVVRGDGLLSLGCFSLGGGHIAGDIVQYLGTSFADAEALKRKAMVSLKPEEDDVYEIRGNQHDASFVNNLVMSRIEIIVNNIKKCLKRNKFEISNTAGYYLTGGGLGYMRGVPQQISRLLGHEVELIVPPIPQMNKPDLSSSLGMLDMMLEADKPQIEKKKSFWSKLFG